MDHVTATSPNWVVEADSPHSENAQAVEKPSSQWEIEDQQPRPEQIILFENLSGTQEVDKGKQDEFIQPVLSENIKSIEKNNQSDGSVKKDLFIDVGEGHDGDDGLTTTKQQDGNQVGEKELGEENVHLVENVPSLEKQQLQDEKKEIIQKELVKKHDGDSNDGKIGLPQEVKLEHEEMTQQDTHFVEHQPSTGEHLNDPKPEDKVEENLLVIEDDHDGKKSSKRQKRKAHKTTPGKSIGRPHRGSLSLLNKHLIEILAPYRVIHSGRRQNTFHPSDVRRLAIISAATLLLLSTTDIVLPEDMSKLPILYRVTAKMTVELSKVVTHVTAGSEPEPFPPNIVLLTGLRGLLIESTRVDLSPVDIDMGDPDMDAELFRMFKSFFGGWCQPFIESFNGYGHVGKSNENSKSVDPVFAEYGDTPAASLLLTQAEKKPAVNEIGSSVDGAGDEEGDDIAGDRPSTGVSQADCTPKRSTRTRTPVKSVSSSKDGGRNWTDGDKELVRVLEKFGFDTDFSHLATQLRNRSENSCRYLVDQLLRSREQMEWEVDLDSKIDQLLNMYPACFLTGNFCFVLNLKSLYDQFPDPAQVGGIMYAECYLFLASLMAGHVPRRISMISKRKLFSVFFRFIRETIAGPQQTTCIFEKNDLSHFESRQDLLERRSKNWTIEETAARQIIQSGNLEGIKNVFASSFQ